MPPKPERLQRTLLPEGSPGPYAPYQSTSTPDASSEAAPEVSDAPANSVPSDVVIEETPSWDQDGAEPPPPGGDAGGGDRGGGGGGDGGGDDYEPPGMQRMSFFDHLEELRRRIFYSLIAVVVGMGVCWAYADNIYAGLAKPLTNVLVEMKMDPKLVYTNPTDVFNLYIKLAMIAGLFLASPFVIYQIWKFISPGLYRHEKKYALPFILFCSTLFISGGAFAYFIAFPAALRFLLSFGSQFRPFITVDEYFGLASTIILGLAIIFELPVLVLFLTLLRIVTPGFLLRNFRYAFLVIVIIAAAVTPTTDIVNMMIFAAPLLGLYFLGVGLSYLVMRARKAKES